MNRIVSRLATLAAAALPALAMAQGEPIKLVNVIELSGAIATAGTNYKNGVELAVKEINAAGGVLGRGIEWITRHDKSSHQEGVKCGTRGNGKAGDRA